MEKCLNLCNCWSAQHHPTDTFVFSEWKTMQIVCEAWREYAGCCNYINGNRQIKILWLAPRSYMNYCRVLETWKPSIFYLWQPVSDKQTNKQKKTKKKLVTFSFKLFSVEHGHSSHLVDAAVAGHSLQNWVWEQFSIHLPEGDISLFLIFLQ